jgi:hypothetical protein
METSFFHAYQAAAVCVRNLVSVSFEPASVSLVHCNTSSCALSFISVELLFRVALPRLSPPCVFPWVLSYDQH